MDRQEIIQKLDQAAVADKSVWIKFDLAENMWDSLRGYVHDIQPSFVTIYTNQGMISVGYSQIVKII